MNEKQWQEIRDFYKDTFGIDEELVDYLSSIDILLMCASGSSNDVISETLDIDLSCVQRIVRSIYDFGGWEDDLPINPHKIHTYLCDMGKPLLRDFKKEVRTIFPSCTDTQIADMFRSCRIYDKISLELDKYWI